MAKNTTVTTKYNREWEEYVVTLREDGKITATYHTNDKDDAKATAEEILRTIKIEKE